MKNTHKHTALLLCIIATFLIGSSFAGAQFGAPIVEKKQYHSANEIRLAFTFDGYSLQQTPEGYLVHMDDFGRLSTPGEPTLPSKIVAVAIPPSAVVSSVSYESHDPMVLSERYTISPISPALPLNENEELTKTIQQQYKNTYTQIYTHNANYPEEIVTLVRTAGFRSYNLVDLRVSPFQYRPLDRKLIFHTDIRITVSYSMPRDTATQPSLPLSSRMQHRAEQFIVNYDQAQQWYSSNAPHSTGLYDYVFITPQNLVDAVQPLVDWETYKGRNVNVVTLESIKLTNKGADLSAKLRSFLQNKYQQQEWGIEDVLLVGHYDDVPMRRVAQDLGYGKPETDFYYAELTRTDSESWDMDGDLLYGESYDDEIDFYAEVSVGRIPWSNPEIVRDICEKTVAFEQNNDPSYKNNILLLGAFFWDDDPNPRTDNAELMEEKIDTQWMKEWTKTRLYEEGWSNYRMDDNISWYNVKNTWSTGKYAFVNWAGHGSPWSSHVYHTGEAFVSTATCSYLNDDYPSIIFADACSNSDTDQENIGQWMLRQGGVGFVGATKVALGRPGWDHPLDGSSQSLDYYFTTRVTSGEYTQGEALQLALQDMYSKGLWSYNHYETLEWSSLWGSPSLSMADLGEFPVYEILDVSGGMMIQVTVQNKGTMGSTNVSCTVQVSGGLLGNVDMNEDRTIEELAINDQQTIQIPITTIGLGPVTVTISLDTRMQQHTGFMVGPFILIIN